MASAMSPEPSSVPSTRARPPVLSTASTPQIDHLFSTLVEAAFDLIAEISGRTTLLVYLHVPHDDQPVLFVREPKLVLLSPTENFRLMHTVTMLSNGRKPSAAFRHGALSGHYNRTSGDRSDGLFVHGPIQTTDTANRVASVSRAFARVLHQFHLDDDDEFSPAPVVATEEIGHITTAAVSMQVDGSPIHGKASGLKAENAVASAVFEAVGRGDVVDDVRRIDVGTRSAVLVAGHAPDQSLRLGLAISGGDILHTTARAALRSLSDQRQSS